MGKRLERVCDHLFGDTLVGKESSNTQILAQNTKGKVNCQLVEIGDSLYNFAKEVERRELRRRMSINLDIGE